MRKKILFSLLAGVMMLTWNPIESSGGADLIHHFEVESLESIEFKTCKTTIKGTIGGKEVNLKLTFEADNCAIGTVQLLKDLAKQ